MSGVFGGLRGAVRQRWRHWFVVAAALGSSACSLSGGFVDAPAFPTPQRSAARTHHHVGAQGSAYFYFPREYRWVAGAQSAVIGQTGPKNSNDQWRFALAGGYSRLPGLSDGPLGFEFVGHLGILRGGVGTIDTPLGAYGGVRAGLPIRLLESGDPWQHDGALHPYFLLVPELGVSEVVAQREQGKARWFIEPFAALNVRLHFTSGLVP